MNTTPTLEDPMTATINPRQHDEAEAALYEQLAGAEQARDRHRDRMHRMAGDRKNTLGRRLTWKMTGAQVIDQLKGRIVAGDQRDLSNGMKPSEALAKQEELNTQVATIMLAIEAAEKIYRQHGWVRFFLCTNTDGHIHSSLHCQTLQPTTQMAWLPEVSGTSVEQAVATYKEGLCTVCFPGAPVAWYEKRDASERAAKQAEKDARAEAKFVKGLRDDEQFKVDGWWITSVHGCLEVLRSEVEFRDYYGRSEHPSHAEYVRGAALATEVLLKREAARPGTGKTQEQIDQVIERAVIKNRKAGARI